MLAVHRDICLVWLLAGWLNINGLHWEVMSWLEAAICWWLPWDSNLRPVGELCLRSPDNMHLWEEGDGEGGVANWRNCNQFFVCNLGKNIITSLWGKYLFFDIPVSVSVCFSACGCVRARWSFSLRRTLRCRVITGDLVSVPRVTDMWSQDKPVSRERERQTEEGRDRAVALHTRWAVVSVFWCFNVLCSDYNAVYADMHRIQGMPKLRVLCGSEQWGKFCLGDELRFCLLFFFFYRQMTWHFSS